MRKKLSIWKVFALSMISLYSMAQAVNVTGTVVEDDGSPLYGVNVTVKGTTNGTITNDAGKYSISAKKGETITFSYVGFETQNITVGNANVINVSLVPDANALGEVVVTALGVARDKRALQYSVTEVDGSNFTKARENNLGNSLSGRIAGVNVSAPATGPAGSSRIVIRGNKTLGGQNQPLYVIDGVPMDNSQNGTAGLWGGADGGDGLSSLNPDDIESITVLKGANAAALYGSRGGNGVINVTTKKGTKRKGLGVEYGLNYVAETINDQSEMQNQFGQGSYVNGVATKPSSIQQASDWGLQGWGPKYDGSQIPNVFGETRPYSYAGNNFDRFYETGGALTNSVGLSGGNGQQNFRLSLADLRSTSIVPNSAFDRTNISFATNSKFGDRLTVSGKILYSKETAKNRPNVSDSPGNANEAVWRLPGNINIVDTKGDPNKPGAVPDGLAANVYAAGNRSPGVEMLSNYSDFWGSNAYWASSQYNNTSVRDRVTASGQVKYDITDFLYVQGRLSTDFQYRKSEGLTPQGTGYNQGGNINESFQNRQENNIDAMIGFDDDFGKFSVNAFVGGNKQYSKYEQISATGNGFSVPFFHALNSANNRNFGYGFSESGINSVFGSAEVGYDNYLFLTATARQDKFSILGGKDILYPSVGASFVFSDAFAEAMPSWMSFGKFRASWAQVGLTGSLGAYQTTQPYGLSGAPHLGRNMARFANSGTIANPFVNPALSTETEIGLDLRFLNGRFGLDLGYYDQKTTNDILNASISTASGFNSTTVNVGELTNEGFEFLFTATPIRKADFSWDISLNFATNKNRVVSLIEGSKELSFEESRTRTSLIKHIVGQPYGTITGVTQKMINGQPVYTATGLPVRDDVYNPIGQSVARLTGGINNNFAYKGFNLSFLIDTKMGGDIHSGTNQRLDQWGFSENSLQGREGQAPLTVTGVNEKGEPLNLTLTPQQSQAYWGNLGDRNSAMYLYDASFVKLRQLVFGYKLPREVISKTPFQAISLSFVGRNLAVLYKNIPNIDPESTYSFNGGAQGLEYFALPATRTYGVSLNITY
jgi:TonB-linked SusC/RagA family outer membrane protein